LNHFFTSFYLLFFSYTLYNSKWFENFQACSQLALRNESKKEPPFWTFFHTNMTLWSAAARFFARTKKEFLSIQTLTSCNLHDGYFWNFFYIISNWCTTRSYGYMCPKMFVFLNLVLVLEMAVLENIWWKHSQKPLGVKLKYTVHWKLYRIFNFIIFKSC